LKHENNELEQNEVIEIKKGNTIVEEHEIIIDGRLFMEKTFISSRGTTIIAHIPVRTPEEEAIAKKELERKLIDFHLRVLERLEKEGKSIT